MCGWFGETGLSSPVLLLLAVPRLSFFCGSFLFFMLHVGGCCAVMSFLSSLVVTCWEMADLLAVVFAVFLSLSQICPGPHQN